MNREPKYKPGDSFILRDDYYSTDENKIFFITDVTDDPVNKILRWERKLYRYRLSPVILMYEPSLQRVPKNMDGTISEVELELSFVEVTPTKEQEAFIALFLVYKGKL